MSRILAIGDIHGCRVALEELIKFVQPDQSDTIIFLGDYIDRGPDSRGVIEFLIQLNQTHRAIFLRGNHEIMMAQSVDDENEDKMWLGAGGRQTLNSYHVGHVYQIPKSHWVFFDSLAPYYETDKYIFVHANAYSDCTMADQPDYMLYWEHLDQPTAHCSGKVIVCGHTSQKAGIPLNFGHTICIDTFPHGGGWLTCLDVNTGQYWQTNEKRKRFQDILLNHSE